MAREIVNQFVQTGMKIDRSSMSNLVITQKNYMYTCIMDLRDKTIYIASLLKPLQGTDDHYGTVTPIHQRPFPCVVLGAIIPPILHKSPSSGHLTSHHQLANFVIEQLRGDLKNDADHFCGFSLRYDGDKKMSLSPTSRTLNPGYNGSLEPLVNRAIAAFLRPKLAKIGLTLLFVEARTDPVAQAAIRGQGAHAAGLFAQIQGKQ
ncbi:MAG: hypothetical protein ACJAYV_002067 [Oleispira sp.]|jgi:hypothetical protein